MQQNNRKTNNTGIMKRAVILTMLAMVLTAGLMACGASQGAHCDAYGSIDTVESSDNA
ncbi:MAG: hypothetical protein ACI9XP_000027 [Lentimonas sp.]